MLKDRSQVLFWILVLVGFLLRLPGFFLNGSHDMEPWVFNWGARVHDLGLAKGFRAEGAYGIISYIFGWLGFSLAQYIPRFWWLPHKIFEFGFEAITFFLLYSILPKNRKKQSVYLYWLNPLFILHNAYLGFWDCSYACLGLMAVFLGRECKDQRIFWVLTGTILGLTALIKPQGALYFVAPVSLFLFVQFIYRNITALFYFVGATALVLASTAILIAVSGGPLSSVAGAYYFTLHYDPGLALSMFGVNVWHGIENLFAIYGINYDPYFRILRLVALSVVLTPLIVLCVHLRLSRTDLPSTMTPAKALFAYGVGAFGITLLFILIGEHYANRLMRILDHFAPSYRGALLVLVSSGSMALIGAKQLPKLGKAFFEFIARRTDRLSDSQTPYRSNYEILFILIVFSSLIIPQFGLKSHTNHTYSALVLLIPIAAMGKRALVPWICMIFTHFILEVQLGRDPIIPAYLSDYREHPTSWNLVSKVIAIDNDDPLRFIRDAQQIINEPFTILRNSKKITTVVCLIQFIAVLFMFREIFRILEERRPMSLLEETNKQNISFELPRRTLPCPSSNRDTLSQG